MREQYDVVVAGGGLAGLCLAIQLKRASSSLRVLVAEKSQHPLPEAAHKVGESSVEVASHYFRNVLGLSEVLAKETPKFGLRFFLSQGANRDIAERLECGPSHFLHVPSFQIDRGRFENALAHRARAAGVDFVDACGVTGVSLGEGECAHTVCLSRGQPAASFEVGCRWLVDASGRAGLLKQKLGLGRSNRHDVNAVWFRLDHPIDLDEWSEDSHWRARVAQPRRLSTNHLMGEGYWVWLIPLVNGRTSVGIVAEAKHHPFSQLRTFDRAMQWLECHEPQCAEAVRAHLDKRMDFRALRNYSHDVKQMFSGDRWCLTGDAGTFIDPFYSPGSDFVGIANGFVCDLITRDQRGEDIGALADVYDQAFRSLARTFLVTYQRQYRLMGDARVMSAKIIWDFVMYWGGVALLFSRDKMCDATFMDQTRPVLQGFAFLNISMQAFFREWADSARALEAPARTFVDYAEINFLAEMNRNLQRECDDETLLEQLHGNLAFARELKREIIDRAALVGGLTPAAQVPCTSHLRALFDELGPERAAGGRLASGSDAFAGL